MPCTTTIKQFEKNAAADLSWLQQRMGPVCAVIGCGAIMRTSSGPSLPSSIYLKYGCYETVRLAHYPQRLSPDCCCEVLRPTPTRIIVVVHQFKRRRLATTVVSFFLGDGKVVLGFFLLALLMTFLSQPFSGRVSVLHSL